MMRPQRNRLLFVAAIIVLLVLGALLRPHVSQRMTPDENVILNANYQLFDTHEGDLVVAGDSITLNAESRVAGAASLVGKTLRVEGQVDGDLTLLGEAIFINGAHINGNANLLGKNVTVDGTIDGDLLVNGASLTILPDAVINGSVNVCGALVDDQRLGAEPLTCEPPVIDPFAPLVALRSSALDASPYTMQVAPVALLVFAVVGALVLMGGSVMAVTFFPRHVSHIEEAMRARPRSFGGVGMAFYALSIGLFFALTFFLALFPPLGLILVPVFLIVGLLLLILSLSGLITLAVILGDWLLRRVSRVPQPPLVAAVTGSLALSAGLIVVSLLPFGFFISVAALGAVSSVGLGASLFTRIGTRPIGRTYFVQG